MRIEGFLCLSEGLIVLVSWNYFQRLWCIYEIACFLVAHHPDKVEMAFDSFLKNSPHETLPKYLEAVENISVKNAKCVNPNDLPILEEKVCKYYDGDDNAACFASFERFAKYSIIALMGKTMFMWRARRSQAEVDGWFMP